MSYYDKTYVHSLWSKKEIDTIISNRNTLIKMGYVLNVENKSDAPVKSGNMLMKVSKPLPSSFCMAGRILSIYDQGIIGSCTANAIALLYKMKNTINPSYEPSRLYIYAKSRLLHSKVLEDEGSDVIYGMEIASRIGICSEKMWPYDISKVNVIPPKSCDDDAKSYKIAGRVFIDTTMSDPILLNIINKTLVSGSPILTAIMLYKSFMDEMVIRTGNVQVPKCKNIFDSNDPIDPFIGGHEVLMVGYDDKMKVFICANSWGSEWGCKPSDARTRGYFYIPYDYILNRDFCIQLCTFKNIIYKDKIV